MDTRTPAKSVEQQIADIKAYMPETYKDIQAKAQARGNSAFAMVRRGLAGQPNSFYAMEGGRVVGTPFAKSDLTSEIAMGIVQFGVGFLALWGEVQAPAQASEQGPAA